MPRQGVPYPSREICSLKCQIDALQRQINELMKSINGVEGDGQGNVSLISGDAAVVINSDAVQNQIEISLDTSQLPAADVSSVNGQTGVVDLDGADIPLNPGQSTPTVQNAVAANAGNISQLQADLNQEILDRGNADSALQTNVNGVSARVSVIEGQISEDPDPNTIGLRGATGRLKAEDPASGATDKTLVTANWVSQTGEDKPNNLIHATGSDRFRSFFQQTGFSNIAPNSQGVNLQIVRPSNNLNETIGSIAITRNISNNNETTRQYIFSLYKDNNNWIRLSLEWVNSNNSGRLVLYKAVNGVTTALTVATL